ncbi:DNA repair protein [Babesia ovis]|uniref:DNA repair protein n=1 Tax=Babesia ovis TaxID=5869 RepID=A0A9W5WUQ5_BABOV|nr:DNA repair protein [Babesia ovis]
MGVNGLIQFLGSRFPDVFRATPSFECFGGKRIFVDCSILLQRNLHAAATAILSKKRQEYLKASAEQRQFIDTRAISREICNYAAKPLLRLNQQLRAVRSNGGIQAVFVLGSSITVRDLYIASRNGTADNSANVLDVRNPNLVPALRAFFERQNTGRLYAAPSEKDMLVIAQRLTDAFARVEIRQPDIAKRCVEFCQDDDCVLSDDTNAIAYGAPNVIRDYCGKNVCNTINQQKLLESMGPERAYRIISSFNTLEAFMQSDVLDEVLKTPTVAKTLERVIIFNLAFIIIQRNVNIEDYKQELANFHQLRQALDAKQARI